MPLVSGVRVSEREVERITKLAAETFNTLKVFNGGGPAFALGVDVKIVVRGILQEAALAERRRRRRWAR